MGTLGSGLTGLGNVQTAGEPPSGGAGGGGTSTTSAPIAKFSATSGLIETPSALYMADDGDLGGGSVTPLRYPTSARTINKLRLSAPDGTGTEPPTATLYKNGVATGLTVTLTASAPAGTNVVVATPAVTFVDGDTFDVLLTQAATADVDRVYTATLEGSADAGDNGYLSDIFDRGEANTPAVHNLMTGPLQRMFINLGTTPPPFPPNAQPFFPEAAVFIGEFPADSGVGADSKPLLRLQRHFSTFPSLGDSLWLETQYDLFGSGVNSITGGDRIQHVLIDQFDNRLTFKIDSAQLTRPGLNAPGYTPTYLDNAPVSYETWAMMDALGGGNSNDWTWNSDGANFRRVFVPNTIGPGGGPAGPWNFVADAMAMWSRNGGEPLVGSRVYHDFVTVQTVGNVDDSVGQGIVGHAAVLDAKNLGSGQAAGHAETWIRSTLGGALTKVANYYDNQIQFLVSVLGAAAVFVGGLTSDGTFATTTGNDANIGGDVNVGTGSVVVGVDVIAGGNVEGDTLNGGVAPCTGVTGTIDFLATADYLINIPLRAGKLALVQVTRFVTTARTGVVAGTFTYSVGNNAPNYDNVIAGVTTAPTAAQMNSGVTVPFSSLGFSAGNLVDVTTNQLHIKNTTAFTGATVLQGYFLLSIWYV